MLVEVWVDVVCPWCYLGKRRLERAIRQFEYGGRVEVVWRSFQLTPDAPVDGGRTIDMLTDRLGLDRDDLVTMNDQVEAMAAEEGLHLHLADGRLTNTLDAHRLLHLARERGLGEALEEAMFRAYFIENRLLGDVNVLADVAAGAGLEPAEIADVLATDRYADAVAADRQEAADLGARGVPFFVIDRVYGIAGAQSVEVIVESLRRAWRHTRALPMATGPAPGSGDGPGSDAT